MKTTLRGGFVCAGLLVGLLLGAQVVSAQIISFPVGGFTTTNVCKNSATPPPACQILTDGSPSLPSVITGGILRLTTANQNQHGAAWFNLPQPLSTGFTTAFQFQISSTNSCFFCSFPADGLALVIQNDPAGTGALGYTGNGQSIAYGNNDVSTASGPGKAIKNSLAIELDTHLNSDYHDPDGNHIAVQSCGPNNASTLTPNSADHNYACPDGNLAKLALQSLPAGMSLTDGKVHTITVNYLPLGSCPSNCNNLSVYLDSTLILQATVDITKQLNLTSNGSAYLGFTAATGSQVQNNDIVSWSFSSLPLAPITINQPLQTTVTNFNYTPALTAVTDYSQSGLSGNTFQGVFMQGTVQSITDQQFSDLVNNTPFQGSTCQHQDTGTGNFNCVTTTDLCTTSTNGNASGANCPNTGTNALILVSNTYNLDPSEKPVVAPGYIMGKDTALNCGASGDNTCKGLVNIFTSITGDALTSGGRTNNFNSILIPILGVVHPNTAATTSPVLNNGWTNGGVTLNFNSTEMTPSNNHNPPSSMQTINNISYSATGANLPNPPTGTVSGASGSITIPGTVEGTTVVTFFATDSSGTVESLITNDNAANTVTSSTPTITIQVDKTSPTFSCTPPAAAWQSTDVSVPCSASDNAGGSGLATPSSFNVLTTVQGGTETNTAQTLPGSVADVAGNTVPVPSYGPFWVDKKAPAIVGLTISPAAPTFGQTVTASYSCTDAGSGVVNCGPSGSGSIPATANTGTLTSPADGSVGTHTVTINAQDAVGNPSTPASVTYTVGKASPTVTFTGAPASAVFGSTFIVSTTTNASTTAVITAAGACSVVGNLVTMTSGTGLCSLTATWAADNNYQGTTAAQSTSATKATTTTTITSVSPNPAVPSQPVAVAVNVAGSTNFAAPTGTMTVTANTGEHCSAAPSAGGCSLTFSTGGQRTATASYGGDGNFNSSSTSTSVLITVGDFSITATPATLTISSGHQAIYTISVTPINGLTGTVNLSCSGAPPNSTCSVSPSADNLQGKPVASTVTLSANKNVNHGTFTLTFTGTYGSGLTHSTSVILTVKGQ
jgi:Bacterial Ig-like domain (group 3)